MFCAACPCTLRVTGILYVPGTALFAVALPQLARATTQTIQSVATNQALRRCRTASLPLQLTSSTISKANELGNQRVAVANKLVGVMPEPGRSSNVDAVCVVPVLTVNVSVSGPLFAVIVKLGGLKAQETCGGSAPHENVMVPV